MFDFDDLVYVDSSNAFASDLMCLQDVDLEQIRIYVGLPSSQRACSDTQQLISDIVEGNVLRACSVVNERELQLASYASVQSSCVVTSFTEAKPIFEPQVLGFKSYVYEHKLQVNEEFTLWFMDKTFGLRPLQLTNTLYPELCKGRLSVEYIMETPFYKKGEYLMNIFFNDQGALVASDFSEFSIANGVTEYQAGYLDTAHYVKPKIDGIQVMSIMCISLNEAGVSCGALVHYDGGYKTKKTSHEFYDSIEFLNDQYYISRRDFDRIMGLPDFPYVVVDILSVSDTDPVRPDTDGFILGTMFQEYKLKRAHTIDLVYTEGGLRTSDGVRVSTVPACNEGSIYECTLSGAVLRPRPDKMLPQDCRTIANYKRMPLLSSFQERVVPNKTPYKAFILPAFSTLRDNGISKPEHLYAFEKNYFLLPMEYKDRYLCCQNVKKPQNDDNDNIKDLVELCSSVVGNHRVINMDHLMYCVLEAGYSFSPFSLHAAVHRGGCFRYYGQWLGPLVIRRCTYRAPDDSRFSIYRLRAKKHKSAYNYLDPILTILSTGRELSTLEIKQLLATPACGSVVVSLKALNKLMPTFATRKIVATGSYWRLDPPPPSAFISAIQNELEANRKVLEEDKISYVKDQGYSDPEVIVAVASVLHLIKKGMNLLVALRIVLGISRDDAHSLVCDSADLYEGIKVRLYSSKNK